jgi:hypothetical protein
MVANCSPGIDRDATIAPATITTAISCTTVPTGTSGPGDVIGSVA